ncbi:unnamed protein product [Bursaphelenchus okinawaensis]|uniref:Calmodulin-binding domain-containing protein n=1 Tax=Bursaphelenchus okinawaensis TaxID=465554 RepID=A0A811LFW2_9BILA|nr:unnamed protein product [Bursaphelenchus okinawaensis]CAG9122170.1 unnamed protein product [Bursaphelenchus okinawaensis]
MASWNVLFRLIRQLVASDSTAKMRCRQRKQLFQQRNQCCDFSLVLGLLGLILVVIDTEITALNIVDKTDYPSIALRSLALVSTVLLIGTIINYHRIEVKIALIDSGADDWRVAVSTDRLIKLSIEILICIVCPFPGSGVVNWTYVREDHHVSSVPVPMDVIMSIPMYLRVYLFCRFMVLHSRQFQDAATRSIAALNRISMDFWFVVKTMMSDHPLRVLIMFTMIYWLCASWAFTQCERWDRPFEHYYMNSLWFVIVTFLSIGYGDVVPRTYVGRALAVLTGIVGAGVSSALIAVISRKLELSRAEKHVNNFMADSKLTNQRKNAAASVLQHTWFIHRYQRSSNKGDDLRLRQHQRKFLNAINEFRRIKWDQRKLQERGNSLLDIGKLHNEMHETLWEMHRTQDQFITQIDLLTQRIGDLQNVIMTQQTPQNGTLSPQNTVNYVSPPGSAYNNYPPNSNHPPFHQPKLASPNPKRYSVQATAITMPEHVLHVQKSSDNTPTGNGGLVHQHAIEKRGTLSQTSNDLEPDETDISASSPLITRQNF